MGKHYDGKRRWNETVLQTSAVGAASKRKRFSGRTSKLSKAMKHVDEETRAIVRNARLDALEADNYGAEDPEATDEADGAYVDEEAQGAGSKDKKKARTGLKRSQPTAAVKSTRWKVKSLAQLLFEEHGAAGVESDPPNYFSAAVGRSSKPARRFCCICGSLAAYSCPRCGSRFCRVRCGDQHKESGCLKFGLY